MAGYGTATFDLSYDRKFNEALRVLEEKAGDNRRRNDTAVRILKHMLDHNETNMQQIQLISDVAFLAMWSEDSFTEAFRAVAELIEKHRDKTVQEPARVAVVDEAQEMDPHELRRMEDAMESGFLQRKQANATRNLEL